MQRGLLQELADGARRRGRACSRPSSRPRHARVPKAPGDPCSRDSSRGAAQTRVVPALLGATVSLRIRCIAGLPEATQVWLDPRTSGLVRHRTPLQRLPRTRRRRSGRIQWSLRRPPPSQTARSPLPPKEDRCVGGPRGAHREPCSCARLFCLAGRRPKPTRSRPHRCPPRRRRPPGLPARSVSHARFPRSCRECLRY